MYRVYQITSEQGRFADHDDHRGEVEETVESFTTADEAVAFLESEYPDMRGRFHINETEWITAGVWVGIEELTDA